MKHTFDSNKYDYVIMKDKDTGKTLLFIPNGSKLTAKQLNDWSVLYNREVKIDMIKNSKQIDGSWWEITPGLF